jgi:hypothetical protein
MRCPICKKILVYWERHHVKKHMKELNVDSKEFEKMYPEIYKKARNCVNFTTKQRRIGNVSL